MKKTLSLLLLLNLLVACGGGKLPEEKPSVDEETSQSETPISLPSETGSGDPSQESEESIPPSIASDDCMDEVAQVHYGENAGFGQAEFPEVVLGPPLGGGETTGSTESVLSLGSFGSITLCSETPILNGEGPDFIVFENAFYTELAENGVFAELATVSVSQDPQGLTGFINFNCSTYSYKGCAGTHPVLANAETNSIDPTDPETAGGDPFDLEVLGLDYAFCVKIEDLDWSALNGGSTAGFDLDAICMVHQ
ncbi:MAG: cell surface protein [Deltaproteobacteria bacterium]|nr:cell surface protein [Deltaproteobacteria bacterium]